jgi:uncharacterized protein
MKHFIIAIFPILSIAQLSAQTSPRFHVIGFFTARNDRAHITFVHEANRWLDSAAAANNFHYDSTNNWDNLNETSLSKYAIVVFLDSRPEKSEHRNAFRKYMENGGGWIGFHFAGFALTPSDFPQNWDWYHNEFIGAGSYKSNTWRPTSAMLRIEDPKHSVVKSLPETFRSAPNEWYRWENDIRENRNIKILASIDPSSFPLGTGPKQDEIWHEGYYPVVWTNKKYNMVYVNMGHNDIDYEGGTNRQLSSSFSSPEQNRLLINALLWLFARQKSG